MFALLMFVSTMSSSHNATQYQITTHMLVQQTDERAGRDCSDTANTVRVYEHAKDMVRHAH